MTTAVRLLSLGMQFIAITLKILGFFGVTIYMKNEILSRILCDFDLENCRWIRDNIYYNIKKTVREILYNCDTCTYRTTYTKYEFLVIAEEGVKKAIIII